MTSKLKEEPFGWDEEEETEIKEGYPLLEICKSCGQLVDPETCWCGLTVDHYYDGHSSIPMGCICTAKSSKLLRVKDER